MEDDEEYDDVDEEEDEDEEICPMCGGDLDEFGCCEICNI